MKRQRGIVALELALILPTLCTLLAVVLFFGRLAYSYEVVQKATRDGVRYLSGVSRINLNNAALANHESEQTQAVVQAELDALGLGSEATILVSCDNAPCMLLGDTPPTQVSVAVYLTLPTILPGYSLELSDQRLLVSRSMRYVGR